MAREITLAALLEILNPEDKLFIIHHLGAGVSEAVAAGTAAELRETGCVSVCGDCTVERATMDAGEWPGLLPPVLLITIS